MGVLGYVEVAFPKWGAPTRGVLGHPSPPLVSQPPRPHCHHL